MLLVPLSIQSQTTNKPRAPAPSRAKPIKPDPPPFAPTFWLGVETSPLRYLGNQPTSVFKWLEKKQLEWEAGLPRKPDEFSTKDERLAYVAAISSSVPSLPPLPLLIECSKKYDVDKQLFIVEVNAGLRISGSDNTDLQHFEVNKALRPRSIVTQEPEVSSGGSYLAQNPFGATIEVERRKSEWVTLLIPFGPNSDPVSAFVYKYPEDKVLGEFGVYHMIIQKPPPEARRISSHLRCLGVISITYPTLAYRENEVLPHRYNNYVRESEKEYGILGKLDQIIVFDKTDGEVYIRISREGLSQDYWQKGKN